MGGCEYVSVSVSVRGELHISHCAMYTTAMAISKVPAIKILSKLKPESR